VQGIGSRRRALRGFDGEIRRPGGIGCGLARCNKGGGRGLFIVGLGLGEGQGFEAGHASNGDGAFRARLGFQLGEGED
jgi:hypothetical protein